MDKADHKLDRLISKAEKMVKERQHKEPVYLKLALLSVIALQQRFKNDAELRIPLISAVDYLERLMDIRNDK